MDGPRWDRGLVVLHAATAVVAAVTVPTLPIGVAALVVVATYEVALLGLALVRRDPTLLRLWWFAAALSVWQLLPDQVLVEVVGSLRFPPDGVPDIGAVTLPMAGMWTVPTVLVVLAGEAARRRWGASAGVVGAGAAALVVFAGAEAVLPGLGVWEPVGVRTVGTVAPYILLAEVVLGVVLWLAWRADRGGPAWRTPFVTGGVSLTYTGAAVASWLFLA